MPGDTLIGLGQTLVWTPPAGSVGDTTAFRVRAWEAGLVSDSDVPVVVNVSPATPTINTTVSAGSIVVGGAISDMATVTGGYSPTGTVTFKLYNNATATGAPLFTDANEPLSGGVASSTIYATTATGTDYWVATYNGDSNNNSVASGAAAEPVTVAKVPPTINTTVSAGSIVVGGAISDTATVTGGYNPSGTVTFKLYNNATATGTPLFTDANEPLSGGVASSTIYATTATGTDYWVATYNGDGNNVSVASGVAAEPVTVAPNPTMINTTVSAGSIVVGGAISDTATVTGGYSPTGTVTFKLYNNATATGTPLFTDANEPLSGGVASSKSYTTTAAGTDYWVAAYNGDSNNNSVASGAAAEPVTVGPGFFLTGPTSGTYTTDQSVPIQWTAGSVARPRQQDQPLLRSRHYTGMATRNGSRLTRSRRSMATAPIHYNWSVNTAKVPAGTYYVGGYLWDGHSNFTFSYLTQPITITASPLFAVTGPKSGTFMAGQVVPILWTAENVASGSTISLCYDTDTIFNHNEKYPEIDRVKAFNGNGGFNWDTTGIAPGTYYIGGYMYGGGKFTFSHLTQAIQITADPPQTFALSSLSPATHTAGDTVNVAWTAGNVKPGSKISLCYDTDATFNKNEHWIEIDGVAAADGSYSYPWNTTGLARGHVLCRRLPVERRPHLHVLASDGLYHDYGGGRPDD